MYCPAIGSFPSVSAFPRKEAPLYVDAKFKLSLRRDRAKKNGGVISDIDYSGNGDSRSGRNSVTFPKVALRSGEIKSRADPAPLFAQRHIKEVVRLTCQSAQGLGHEVSAVKRLRNAKRREMEIRLTDYEVPSFQPRAQVTETESKACWRARCELQFPMIQIAFCRLLPSRITSLPTIHAVHHIVTRRSDVLTIAETLHTPSLHKASIIGGIKAVTVAPSGTSALSMQRCQDIGNTNSPGSR
ncbi:hypothetical protein DFH06DRAFT_392713 [Mycena polygramma]|nr:hypothetical protein DFH06DRAFT_392713 [Mycena polygramma]